MSDLEDKLVSLIRQWLDENTGRVDVGNIILYDGTELSLLAFKSEDFNPEHCFNILPNIVRYNGNVYLQFSVGHHSLLCYEIAQKLFPTQKLFQFLALTHDFPEALLGDCITPIKKLPILNGFVAIEDHIADKMYESFNVQLDEEMHNAIKLVDKLALSIEVHNLFRYSNSELWRGHIFSMEEVKALFENLGSKYDPKLIQHIVTLQPRQVEVLLRNAFSESNPSL